MKPIALFDLDGTLRDTGNALYPRASDISIYPGVPERLLALRRSGYLLAGVTNQGGARLGVVTEQQVGAAIARTQQLLGNAALDAVFYCPHHRERDGHDCDCKKPACGMALDALTAVPHSTLDGGFIVGDSKEDADMAAALALPFLAAGEFRRMTPEGVVERAQRHGHHPAAKPNEKRVAGCLVGLAIGDALGAPLEFKPRSAVRSEYPSPLREMKASHSWAKGEYTDDTQMALLLAESLLENGGLVPANLARSFQHWASTAKDVGLQTRAVLGLPGYAVDPERCSRDYCHAHHTSAAGNGALMRCAPVALFHLGSPSMLIADSRRSARVTHADPKAQSSCVLLNAWIAAVILDGVKDGRERAMRLLPGFESAAWQRLAQIETLDDDEISSSGYTVHTLEAAAWSFLNTASFEDAVVNAANLGDDADTVAAVTGALAGAYYGYDAIPQRWRDALIDEANIRSIALRLAKAEAATSAAGQNRGG